GPDIESAAYEPVEAIEAALATGMEPEVAETGDLSAARGLAEPDGRPLSAEGERFAIAFRDQDLSAVLAELARIARRRGHYAARVKGTVHIVAEEPVDREQALHMFESILHLKGFTLVDDPPGELTVVPLAEVHGLPLAMLDAADPPLRREAVITR